MMWWGLAALGVVMNALIRGGWYKTLWPNLYAKFDLKGEDWYAGAVWGLVFAGFSGAGQPWPVWAVLALWSSLCMVAGATPGWGTYIAAMRGENSPHSVGWGILRMTLRGGWWGFCLALAAAVPAIWLVIPNWCLFAAAAMAGGLMQGAVYYGMILLFRELPYMDDFNHWSMSEVAFSPFLWVFPFMAMMAA